METLLELLDTLAREAARGLTEYDRRGRAAVRRSYAEIARRARGHGATLAEHGVGAGQVVFLQLPNGLDLVESFLGAVGIGALPCCLAPPRALGGIEAYRARMGLLFDAFAGCHLVADRETGERSGQPFQELRAVDASGAGPASVRMPAPEDVAFVQLTSGTSNAPKAVRISHRALLANADGILSGGRGQPEDAYVSWLPLYHDMGLVGMLFCALRSGADLHLFRPETFAARPLLWLDRIARVGLGEGDSPPASVVTTAPNFAYQHCVDAIAEGAEAGLDLSRWRVAGCGAERVRPETLDEFAARFGPVGFRAEAFVPCYGMAEATLAVTFTSRDRAPVLEDGHVGCGHAVPATEIVIRDPAGNPLDEGVQGEITVRGPGLCSGYAPPQADAGAALRDGWLHTGDRGFVRDGELFVTGRIKDLIIIDGHNLDPDEVEAIADRVVRCSGGRCGAFAVEVDGRERVVLAVETPPKSRASWDAWADEIGTGVAAALGLRLHDLRFVARGDLPTTSSGKVQRARLREAYLDQAAPFQHH